MSTRPVQTVKASRIDRLLPPGMLAYIGPAALSFGFINHAGSSYLMAVHRLQAKPHEYSTLAHELLMPFDERLTLVANAIHATSPGLMRVIAGKWMISPVLGFLFSLIVPPSNFWSPMFFPIVYHPIDSRVRHLQALPPTPLSAPAFPEGVFGTLSHEGFYLRSLEPNVYLQLLRHLINKSRLVHKMAIKLTPDRTHTLDWTRIHKKLVAEYDLAPANKGRCHAKLRVMYARRWNRWFLRHLTETLLENYAVRTLLFPLEVLYTRLCCTPRYEAQSFWSTLFNMIDREGLPSLYSGYSLLLSALVPHLLTLFTIFSTGRLLIAYVDPARLAQYLDFSPPEIEGPPVDYPPSSGVEPKDLVPEGLRDVDDEESDLDSDLGDYEEEDVDEEIHIPGRPRPPRRKQPTLRERMMRYLGLERKMTKEEEEFLKAEYERQKAAGVEFDEEGMEERLEGLGTTPSLRQQRRFMQNLENDDDIVPEGYGEEDEEQDDDYGEYQ